MYKQTVKMWLENVMFFLLLLFFISVVPSCSDDDAQDPIDVIDDEDDEDDQYQGTFTLALSASPTGETKMYTQTLTNLKADVTVSYDGYGFEMPSTRTARIFSADEGGSLFNLDYGGGRIYKYSVDGGQEYSLLFEKNVEFAMGTAYPRWTKASEESASIQYAGTAVADTLDDGTFVKNDVPLRIMNVALEDLSFNHIEEFNIPVTATDLTPYTMADQDGVDAAHYNYVGRVDAPVISGDKIYYGMSKSAYCPTNPCSGRGCPSATYQNTETLVLDYPELTNPSVISTDIARGATNGYRTPVAHKDENGDVYQIITVPDATYDTYILKISDGAYDDSFKFNLSDLLDENTRSCGWFYVGEGIGYVPYLRSDESEDYADSNWSVARVDLYSGTAIKMNLPENLWLRQYQNGVLKNGLFYMAITPTGENGNIYIFDVDSTSPDGFESGATLENLAEGTYIGVY